MAEKFLQHATIEAAIVPIDLAGQANDGDWVSLEGYERCVVVFVADAGAAGEDPVFTLRQASDNAGTGAKALNFTTIYEKVGTLTGVTAFTRVAQAAANTYTNAASGEAQNIIAVEVKADELDVDNGFTHLQLQIPDTGATAGKLGCALYIMLEPRYSSASMPSALS